MQVHFLACPRAFLCRAPTALATRSARQACARAAAENARGTNAQSAAALLPSKYFKRSSRKHDHLSASHTERTLNRTALRTVALQTTTSMCSFLSAVHLGGLEEVNSPSSKSSQQEREES